MAQLVFVHGRAQQFKDAAALKTDWIEALKKGLRKSGEELRIAERDIRFPYYGQALHDLVTGVPDDRVAEVVIKGSGEDVEKRAFIASVAEELAAKAGVSEAEVEAEANALAGAGGVAVREKGPLNWGWVQAILQAVDRRVRGGSSASIALFTNDVYEYLRNPGFRDRVEQGVLAAILPGEPTVVVGHSLGSVVAYNILRREAKSRNWRIPLFVTVGSPLAVTMIKKALRPIGHPANVDAWFNAMDERDVVSLYPLDATHFKVSPQVENKTDVDNHTDNRHGIAGYLDDRVVAKRIHDALMA